MSRNTFVLSSTFDALVIENMMYQILKGPTKLSFLKFPFLGHREGRLFDSNSIVLKQKRFMVRKKPTFTILTTI